MKNPIAFARRFFERALDVDRLGQSLAQSERQRKAIKERLDWELLNSDNAHKSAMKIVDELDATQAAHRATLAELEEARAVIDEQQRELEEYERESTHHAELTNRHILGDGPWKDIDEDPPQEPDLVPVEEHRETYAYAHPNGKVVLAAGAGGIGECERCMGPDDDGPFRVRLERVKTPVEITSGAIDTGRPHIAIDTEQTDDEVANDAEPRWKRETCGTCEHCADCVTIKVTHVDRGACKDWEAKR